MQDDYSEGSAALIGEEDHQKGQKVEANLTTYVLGDLFHIVDRVKFPMHHDFKSVFQDIWVVFFIIDAVDA